MPSSHPAPFLFTPSASNITRCACAGRRPACGRGKPCWACVLLVAWVVSLTRASTLDGTGDLGLDVHMKLPLLEFFRHGASDRMQMGRRAGGQPRRAEATVRRMGGYGKERDSRGLLLVRLDRCLLTGQRMTVSHLGALAVGGGSCAVREFARTRAYTSCAATYIYVPMYVKKRTRKCVSGSLLRLLNCTREESLRSGYIAHQCTDGGKIDAGLADGWIGSWCWWRLFCYRCQCGQSGLLGYIVGCQLHDGEVLVQCSW